MMIYEDTGTKGLNSRHMNGSSQGSKKGLGLINVEYLPYVCVRVEYIIE